MSSRLPPELKKDLVTWAEAIAEAVRNQRGQASQLRNLLQIAQTESEIPVLANFIRYQAGRNNKRLRDFWEPIHEQMIRRLQEIAARQELVAAEELAAAELRRTAIQHFFGYLVRHYFYVTRLTHRAAGGAAAAARRSSP